jgi:hypothetical protein
MVLRLHMLAVAAVAVLHGSGVGGAVPPDLQPLSFLVGSWEASGAGQPGSGVGTFVFSWSLQDRVMVRNSFAEYAATGATPASRHDDLMIIYAGSNGVRADYFDNEGHVIRYSVRPSANQAVFTSDVVAGEPRFRIRYTRTADGGLEGEFEIAAPDAPETFKQYLSWHSRKTAARKQVDR